MTNITSGEFVAHRYFYTADCATDSCGSIELPQDRLTLYAEPAYNATFALTLNDQRGAFVSTGSMPDIQIKAEILQTTSDGLSQVMQEWNWQFSPVKVWDEIEFLSFDEGENSTRVYNDYAALANMASGGLAFLLSLFFVVRRLRKSMIIEIKYSQVLKKFETGAKHLELNTKIDPKEEKEIKRRMLEADGANEERMKLLMEESKEDDDEVVRDDQSMVSHYVEDEEGRITRIMVQK